MPCITASRVCKYAGYAGAVLFAAGVAGWSTVSYYSKRDYDGDDYPYAGWALVVFAVFLGATLAGITSAVAALVSRFGRRRKNVA